MTNLSTHIDPNRFRLFEKDKYDKKWDIFLDTKEKSHLWRYQIKEKLGEETPLVCEDCKEEVEYAMDGFGYDCLCSGCWGEKLWGDDSVKNRFEILDL